MDVGVSIGASVSGQEYILFSVGTCSLRGYHNLSGHDTRRSRRPDPPGTYGRGNDYHGDIGLHHNSGIGLDSARRCQHNHIHIHVHIHVFQRS